MVTVDLVSADPRIWLAGHGSASTVVPGLPALATLVVIAVVVAVVVMSRRRH